MKKDTPFILLLMFVLLSSSCIPKQEIQIVQAELRGITVTGQGEIKVSPDSARIVFNVVTRDRDVLLAKEHNQQILAKVLATLTELDVKDTSIKTNFVNISPESGGTAPLYNATTPIQVTTHDLDKVEGIVTGILKSIAVEVEGFYYELNIQGIYFEVANMDYYRGQARSMALQDAKSKAITMANELGQEIGDPIFIQDTTGYPGYTNNYSYAASNEYMYYRNPDNRGVGIFDKITVVSTVTIKFRLK